VGWPLNKHEGSIGGHRELQQMQDLKQSQASGEGKGVRPVHWWQFTCAVQGCPSRESRGSLGMNCQWRGLCWRCLGSAIHSPGVPALTDGGRLVLVPYNVCS
jgi:hypothetical protein